MAKTEITPSAPRYGGEDTPNTFVDDEGSGQAARPVSDAGGSTNARIGGGFTGSYGSPMHHEVNPQKWSATYAENGSVVFHTSGAISDGYVLWE